MENSIGKDPRIDPRIRQAFGDVPSFAFPSFESREQLLAAREDALGWVSERGQVDHKLYEAVAPLDGLSIRKETITSQPDGNSINLQIIAPEGEGPWPCVYYIHGGGMAFGTCFDPSYSAFGRLVAANGIAVIMVDFRNSAMPSSVPDVAPFPAGLNDCISGLRWLRHNASDLKIDAGRIVVAGESGGGNLTIALELKLRREGCLDLIKGLYAMCPHLAAEGNDNEASSSKRNNGLLVDLSSNFLQMAYGMDELEACNPLAWPSFATEEDVTGFPPVVIRVNEFDPLLDDGVAFYRLLLRAGVDARCNQVMGTVHGTEVMVLPCPDISRDAARELAAFARGD